MTDDVTAHSATDRPADQQYVLKPKIAAALLRYRISAFTVGVGLLLLCAAMVAKYGYGMDWAVAIWGPIHGVLYAVYVLLTFDFAYKTRWRLWNLLKVLLAGVVPVLSFYAEHWVTRKIRSGEPL